MKTQQQIENFIETVENLIPKLEEKKLEYLRQGNEFHFNVMKGKTKERLIELNALRWVLDNSTKRYGSNQSTSRYEMDFS